MIQVTPPLFPRVMLFPGNPVACIGDEVIHGESLS